MRKTLSVLLVAAFAAISIPTASAETVSDEYLLGSGVRIVGVGIAVMCPNSCLAEDTAGEMPNIGGTHLTALGIYTNVVVSVNDEGLWGNNAAVTVCFWNPDGDNICDADDVSSGHRCGTAAILGSQFASNYVTTWVQGLVVTEELDVCGGTFGSATGDFF